MSNLDFWKHAYFQLRTAYAILQRKNKNTQKQNAELAKALSIMVSRDAAMVPLQQLLSVAPTKKV